MSRSNLEPLDEASLIDRSDFHCDRERVATIIVRFVAVVGAVVLLDLALELDPFGWRTGYPGERPVVWLKYVFRFIVFLAGVGWSVVALRGIDSDRRRAVQALQAANEALGARVLERAGVEDELRASVERYRFLADSMPQIVWTARPDGGLDYYNRRWYDFTGMTFEQTRDWGWGPVLHPNDLQICTDRWTQAIQTGQSYEVEYRFKRASDGTYRWHLGRALPMLDASGEIVHWFGTCTDIDDQKRAEKVLRHANDELEQRVHIRTAELAQAVDRLQAEIRERLRAEDELRRAKDTAEAATRAKGEFLANVSPEIRTPMNGILGMIDLALIGEVTASQRECPDVVKSSAESLLTVINDILDFSKIEAGRLGLDPVPFGLRDCLDDILRSLALRAHTKGLKLSGRIAPGVPDALVGDPGRLRQILVNLVGNSVKFTSRGEIAVTIEPAPTADGDDVVSLLP